MAIDLVQKFDAEVDSLKLLRKYLYLAIETILESNQEITVKFLDNQNISGLPFSLDDVQNLTLFLIGGWYIDSSVNGSSYVLGGQKFIADSEKTSIDGALDFIIKTIKNDRNNLYQKFLEKCGSGYDHSFNECDGSVKVGYQISSLSAFPAVLAVSLVHIYYGK